MNRQNKFLTQLVNKPKSRTLQNVVKELVKEFYYREYQSLYSFINNKQDLLFNPNVKQKTLANNVNKINLISLLSNNKIRLWIKQQLVNKQKDMDYVVSMLIYNHFVLNNPTHYIVEL
jgi:ribosomal protein S8